MKKNRLNQKGYTLLEMVIGTVILTVVSITASQVITDIHRNSNSITNTRDVSSLARMVFDQYESYAADHFDSLDTYDTEINRPKTPAEFFNRSDNMGFNHNLITTKTEYSTNRATCTVKVTIISDESRGSKEQVFTKTFSDQLGTTAGATVRIKVIPACSNHTSHSDIAANCPPLPGFEIAIPSMGGGVAVGVTGPDGTAVVHKALIGDAVPIEVTAPQATPYTVTASSAFKRGYWVQGEYGPTRVLRADYPISNIDTVDLVFTQFRPTGRIYGTVEDQDNNPLGGVTLRLEAPAYVFVDGVYRACDVDLDCELYSSQGAGTLGRYEFANVIVSSLTNIPLWVKGDQGSGPYTLPGNPAFRWGYGELPRLQITPGLWTQTDLTRAPTVERNFTLRRFGYFRVRTQTSDGTAIAGAKVRGLLPTLLPYRTQVNLPEPPL